MSIGQIFGLATIAVLLVNAIASRFARNCGAVNLSLAFVMAWAATNTMRAQLPLPWAWVPAGLINLGLLAASLYVARHTRSRWAWFICAPLLVGLTVQVDLWISWWPHRHEAYDLAVYSIYLRYWWMTISLATVELAALTWPGGHILGNALLDRLFPVPRIADRRRGAVRLRR